MKPNIKLINDPFDLEILSFIDGKTNINKISELTGYTYKSVFHRIKKIEKKGFIIPHKTKDITEGVLFTINKSYLDQINHELKKYQLSKNLFHDLIKNPLLKEETINLLKLIEKKRFINDGEIDSYILTKKPKLMSDLIMIKTSLEEIGIIRIRTEITRRGKKFLKDHSETHK